MSADALSWAFGQPAPSTAKFVLVAIADHANPSGVCFPGQQRLAEMTGYEVSTVIKSMKALESGGLIARVERRRRDNMRTSDWIVLAPTLDADERKPLKPAVEQEHYPEAVLALFTPGAADETSHGSRPGESPRPQSDSHLDLSSQVTSTRSRALREEPPEGTTRENQPPLPPQGGRARDRARFDAVLNDWASERFPGVEPKAVVGYATEAIRRGARTWDQIAGHVERLHSPARRAA